MRFVNAINQISIRTIGFQNDNCAHVLIHREYLQAAVIPSLTKMYHVRRILLKLTVKHIRKLLINLLRKDCLLGYAVW